MKAFNYNGQRNVSGERIRQERTRQRCTQSEEPQPQDMPPVPRKSKRSIIIAACVLALVAVVGIFVGVQQKQASDRTAYIASLNELRAQTIRGGSVAEKMCNLTKQVWYNTIYEERDSITDKYTRSGGVFHDDFNTSLSLLYAEDNTATVISGLQASRELVDGIMADLQNPPAEFAACYEAADSLYDAYCGLIDFEKADLGKAADKSPGLCRGYGRDAAGVLCRLPNHGPSEITT